MGDKEAIVIPEIIDAIRALTSADVLRCALVDDPDRCVVGHSLSHAEEL